MVILNLWLYMTLEAGVSLLNTQGQEMVRFCQSIARVCGLHVTDPAGRNVGLSSVAVGLPADLKLRHMYEAMDLPRQHR